MLICQISFSKVSKINLRTRVLFLLLSMNFKSLLNLLKINLNYLVNRLDRWTTIKDFFSSTTIEIISDLRESIKLRFRMFRKVMRTNLRIKRMTSIMKNIRLNSQKKTKNYEKKISWTISTRTLRTFSSWMQQRSRIIHANTVQHLFRLEISYSNIFESIETLLNLRLFRFSRALLLRSLPQFHLRSRRLQKSKSIISKRWIENLYLSSYSLVWISLVIINMAFVNINIRRSI